MSKRLSEAVIDSPLKRVKSVHCEDSTAESSPPASQQSQRSQTEFLNMLRDILSSLEAKCYLKTEEGRTDLCILHDSQSSDYAYSDDSCSLILSSEDLYKFIKLNSRHCVNRKDILTSDPELLRDVLRSAMQPLEDMHAALKKLEEFQEAAQTAMMKCEDLYNQVLCHYFQWAYDLPGEIETADQESARRAALQTKVEELMSEATDIIEGNQNMKSTINALLQYENEYTVDVLNQIVHAFNKNGSLIWLCKYLLGDSKLGGLLKNSIPSMLDMQPYERLGCDLVGHNIIKDTLNHCSQEIIVELKTAKDSSQLERLIDVVYENLAKFCIATEIVWNSAVTVKGALTQETVSKMYDLTLLEELKSLNYIIANVGKIEEDAEWMMALCRQYLDERVRVEGVENAKLARNVAQNEKSLASGIVKLNQALFYFTDVRAILLEKIPRPPLVAAPGSSGEAEQEAERLLCRETMSMGDRTIVEPFLCPFSNPGALYSYMSDPHVEMLRKIAVKFIMSPDEEQAVGISQGPADSQEPTSSQFEKYSLPLTPEGEPRVPVDSSETQDQSGSQLESQGQSGDSGSGSAPAPRSTHPLHTGCLLIRSPPSLLPKIADHTDPLADQS